MIFLLITAPPTLTCPDGFFHTKMAILIKEQGIIQDFPWTQFVSFSGQNFVDQHLGFHLLLIPFLYLPSPKNLDILSQELEPLLKTKLATLIFASLIFVLIYWLLRRFKIRGAIFYTFLPIFVSTFMARISLIRAPVVSVIFLLLGIYLILKERYFWLFILSFFYVWLYGAWPLILLALIIYCLANALKNIIEQPPELSDKIKNQNRKIQKYFYIFLFLVRHFFTKSNVKLLLACILGLTLGLVINPYFPKDIYFHFNELLKIAIINYHHKIGVGAEWYPPDPKDLFISIYPVLVPWLIAIAWFIISLRKQNLASWTFSLLSAFFLIYTLKARRNVEYFTPLAVLSIGLSLESLWSTIDWSAYRTKIKELFQSQYQLPTFILSLFRIFILIFFLGTILYLGPLRLHYVFKTGWSLFKFQDVSHWLKTNTQANSIIYNVSWDIFPALFYFNTHNYYINGLDQTFMYEHDPELYKKWAKIFKGAVPLAELPLIIKNDFKSSYVLIDKHDKKTKAVDNLFQRSPAFKKVYEDEEAKVFQLIK
ncbi:MAG: hypothetical protein ACPL3E_02425 [Minisyncoccia bacterium]